MKRLVLVLFLTLMFNSIFYPVYVEAGKKAIRKGSRVAFDYTLTVDGKVIDSSGKEPYQYTHDEGKIIPALYKQLKGLKEGDEKRIKVSPEEGYGRVNPMDFREIPKSALAADLEPQIGMELNINRSDGKPMYARILKIKDNVVVVNLNHPLAGKTLIFDVKIVSVE